jgi:hypothetical protein
MEIDAKKYFLKPLENKDSIEIPEISESINKRLNYYLI